jgi:hypothetical protein
MLTEFFLYLKLSQVVYKDGDTHPEPGTTFHAH